jgi:DNA-binding CsgD family transcriptional regulator
MFLVDADGRVVHANAAGAAMLRRGLALRMVSGRLAAVDARASPALLGAIAAAKGGDTALADRGIAVTLTTRDGERYVVHMLPLTSAERRGASTRRGAVAALLVQKAALELRATSDPIAKAFDLTPTELRVLLAVVEASGVAETAAALGLGQATVKTHLHRLFGKTDTRRQADLVKLVAGFASPLAD